MSLKARLNSLKHLIENHFNSVMLLGLLAGLFLPGLPDLPGYAVIITMSVIIFFSCAKVSLTELKFFNLKASLFFYILRFLCFPVLLYYAALPFFPDYALGILLLALMPVGVGASAIANIARANASLALSYTVITHLLAPLAVPAVIFLVAGMSIEIDIASLARTLSLCIFLPAAIYFLIVRRSAPAKAWVKRESHFFSVLLLGIMGAQVVALQREYFFTNPGQILLCVILSGALYVSFYGAGWLAARLAGEADRTIFSLCSGVNNISLSISLAVLYFSPATALFTVGGEVSWILGVAAFKKIAGKQSSTVQM